MIKSVSLKELVDLYSSELSLCLTRTGIGKDAEGLRKIIDDEWIRVRNGSKFDIYSITPNDLEALEYVREQALEAAPTFLVQYSANSMRVQATERKAGKIQLYANLGAAIGLPTIAINLFNENALLYATTVVGGFVSYVAANVVFVAVFRRKRSKRLYPVIWDFEDFLMARYSSKMEGFSSSSQAPQSSLSNQ